MNNKPRYIAGASFVTASLIALWTQLEGIRYMPYLDVAGIPTVCAGHTGPDVVMGVAWSKRQCDEVTERDLTKFGFVVIRCVYSPLSRNQFEALVVFAGNVGEWAFCNSSLVRKLNEMDYAGAEMEFERWTFAGGQHVPGLLNRRRIELAKFRQVDPMAARGSAIFWR